MTAGFLSLRNVVKAYNGSRVVDDVSMDIGRSEFVTLLGGSGSGKTTTLMMIAGFTLPEAGSIYLDGQDITFLPPSQRNVGVVFQNYSLFPHMSVFENVAYPLRVRRMRSIEITERVRAALDLVQLTGYDERLPSQLSGGQQQRVAFARAVVFEPRLLLMDEPLGALDKKLRDHLQLEILRFQKKLKVAVVYVTHDQNEALTMSDRIAIVHRGRLEQVGTPRELYHRPKTRFVADFVGEASFVEGVVCEVNSSSATLQVAEGFIVTFLPSTSVTPGNVISLMVRPEVVRPANDLPNAENRVTGVVQDIVYTGEYTKYKLLLPGGQMLLMKQASNHGTIEFNVGDAVPIAWSVKDGRHV
ncbi:MAG: ABC transporter ATP-binding protein [Bradyrhizobium sp.]|uniref:ABC transporter ATP-binding protein n=1 Tax=Bradyrhizobium sp. TaxID=376 RepID=UPI00121078B9|nr:ABC transporter ATP-binding protein [Bradyrhizobium sp.]THD72734.1 MAG: ABC transporter ATP-binding protein [Bradyrhizobium sp.]